MSSSENAEPLDGEQPPQRRGLLIDLFGVWMLLFSWGPGVAAIAAFHYHPAFWTFALAFLVVAARQHALFVVAHESFHGNLFRSRRVNELAGAWLACYPIVMPFRAARQGHWDHHRHVGTDSDPDRFAWDWKPDERGAFMRNLLATMSGVPFVIRALRTVLGRPTPPVPGRPERSSFGGGRVEIVYVGLTHLVLLGLFAGSVGWVWYFALWLLPAISLRIALDETRQFLEHQRGTLAVFRAGPLERFFMGPFNFHLHAYHHALASVPWFRVPGLESQARARLSFTVNSSYAAVLYRYLSGKSAGA